MYVASLHIYINSKKGEKTWVTSRKLGTKRQCCHTLNLRLAGKCNTARL